MSKKKDDAEATGVEIPEADGGAEFTEADAEAAFAEGLGEPASEAPAGTIPAAAETPEGPEITAKTGQPGEADPTETPGKTDKDSAAKAAGEGDLSPKQPSYADLEKQLNDTKAWATGLSQTVADLKKKVEGPPAAVPAKKELPAEPEIPDDVKQYLSDYPEAQKAIDFFANQLLKKTLGDLKPAEIQQTLSGLQDQLAQANFEKSIISGFRSSSGKWIDGHPDAYKIMATEDYGKWFQGELGRDPNLGGISDPAGAIDVLNRYKKAVAASAASAHDASGTDLARDVKDIASGTVQPGTREGSLTKTKTDEDKSPEEIFEQHAT